MKWIVLVLLGSKIFSATPPDWVYGKSKKYSDEKYILGVGWGKNIDEAKNSARAEILKFFKVEIKQKTVDIEKYSSGKGLTTQIDRTIESSTEGILKGVQILETYKEKEDKYYALAGLSRLKAKLLLMDEIQNLESEIKVKKNEAQTTDSPLKSARIYALIIEKLKNLKILKTQLSLVSPTSSLEIPQETNIEEVKSKLENILKKQILIFVEVSDPQNSTIKTTISQTLVDKGLSITDVKSDALILVKAEFNIKEKKRDIKGWHFFEWNFSASLYEKEKLFATFSKSGYEGQTTLEGAKEKSILVGKKEASSELVSKIYDYIFKSIP